MLFGASSPKESQSLRITSIDGNGLFTGSEFAVDFSFKREWCSFPICRQQPICRSKTRGERRIWLLSLPAKMTLAFFWNFNNDPRCYQRSCRKRSCRDNRLCTAESKLSALTWSDVNSLRFALAVQFHTEVIAISLTGLQTARNIFACCAQCSL